VKDLIGHSDALRGALKQMIIDTLRLEDVTVDDIEDNDPLFRDGLGLDSIDALELVVAIEKHFGIAIENEDVGKRAFASVAAMAVFLQESLGAKAA